MNIAYSRGSFGYDLAFLRAYDSEICRLSSHDGLAQVLVSAKYQGKVFTSTAQGMNGRSLGYVNHAFFEKKVMDEHMNGFGGENRLWIGPEGGAYSLFFAPGSEQIYTHWHTPKAFDTEPWDVLSQGQDFVKMSKEMSLPTYRGFALHACVEREIRLFSRSDIQERLGLDLHSQTYTVGYETTQQVTNLNDYAWSPETGTLCLWVMDMLPPSREAVTIIPYRAEGSIEQSEVVNTTYFGGTPPDRYHVGEEVILMRTDGEYRSKMGLRPPFSVGMAGNYDPLQRRLTVVRFDSDPSACYLTQEWDPQADPLVGEVFHAYNDGPLEDGTVMGPFLELESSSPAALLPPRQTLSHTHEVFHFVGDQDDLSTLSCSLLGISLEDMMSHF